MTTFVRTLALAAAAVAAALGVALLAGAAGTPALNLPPATVATASAAYTVPPGVDHVVCDPSGGGFTVTLPPTGGGTNRGRVVTVLNATSSTNTVTVAAQGSGVTVDGAASVSIATGYGAKAFECSGTNWFTIAGGKHAAGELASGTVAAARLGTGTIDATTFLRGDSTWQPAPLVLPVQFLQNNPTDAQTIYAGNMPRAPLTTGGVSRCYLPRDGTVTAVEVYTYANSAAGTNENWSCYFRYDDTTDTLVETIGASTAERRFDNSSLSISVAGGHYFEIKFINPTWVTNPTAVTMQGWVYLK